MINIYPMAITLNKNKKRRAEYCGTKYTLFPIRTLFISARLNLGQKTKICFVCTEEKNLRNKGLNQKLMYHEKKSVLYVSLTYK